MTGSLQKTVDAKLGLGAMRRKCSSNLGAYRPALQCRLGQRIVIKAISPGWFATRRWEESGAFALHPKPKMVENAQVLNLPWNAIISVVSLSLPLPNLSASNVYIATNTLRPTARRS